MSKKTKDKNKDKGKTEAGNDQSEGSLPVGAAVGMKIAFALAAVAVVVVGMYLLRENVLSSSTRPAGESVRVRLVDPPEWLPGNITDGVVADIQSVIKDRGTLDNDLTKDVFNAAGKNPWISKVHKVTRQKDRSVLVRADFRRPFALVAFRPLAPGDVRVVDSGGVVLPLLPRLLNARGYVRIREITTDPPPAGEKWDSKPLADALKLLGLIKDKPYISRIGSIEIERIIKARVHLVMYAFAGDGRRVEILFGRFPADDLDYCVSPARKIANLDKVVSANGGRFDAIREIDLRHDEPHYRPY
ncbi:MAG: hypothetical protein KAV00_12485 [Phycisphaerae bacterium]|nr:hypothetical protein [Phycisphaerae bacterium]